MAGKILIKDKTQYKDQLKYWKSSTYNQYEFEDGEPTSYPFIAVVSSFSVPDTYLTEYSVSYVYLKDFN